MDSDLIINLILWPLGIIFLIYQYIKWKRTHSAEHVRETTNSVISMIIVVVVVLLTIWTWANSPPVD